MIGRQNRSGYSSIQKCEGAAMAPSLFCIFIVPFPGEGGAERPLLPGDGTEDIPYAV